MEEMLLDIRVNNRGEILEDDMMILDTKKKMVSNSKDPKVQKMYECHQQLWHSYIKHKNILNKIQNQNFAKTYPKYALGDIYLH